MESLERLKELHLDLLAFTETRLANVDRLWLELQASVEDFRKLLEKPSKSKTSRQSLASGTIKIDGEELSVNREFQQISEQVADVLDIDELVAAKLVLSAQENSPLTEHSPGPSAIILFHQNRELLLQNIQLVLQAAVVGDDSFQEPFQDLVADVLEIRDGPAGNGSAFARKCLSSLEHIERWRVRVLESIQKVMVVGPGGDADTGVVLDFQKSSLTIQHEVLSAIVALLFKGNYTTSEDLRKLLDVPKRWDRLDPFLFHYFPVFSAAFAQYGSPDHGSSLQDARSLHDAVVKSSRHGSSSALQPFHSVLVSWWLAEYTGWYRESQEMSPVQGIDLEKEAEERLKLMTTALGDGALELLLSICNSLTLDEWRDPARHELVMLLLSDVGGFAVDGEYLTESYRALFMESLEQFAESWITNMPDALRRLKYDEDDRRLHQITALQDGLVPTLELVKDPQLHLECFLVMISFAFEHRLEAAEEFWTDMDSNLYGFLQWASRRQTVPRVSAFCEMLYSISEGPDCSAAAHKFLLDETSTISSRSRKSPSMSYNQMLRELELYANKVHERPPGSQMHQVRKVLPTDMNELESPIMLSCYLRLISHMCRECAATREFILANTSFKVVPMLLILCSGPVPSYLRASIFATLDAVMVDKVYDTSYQMWSAIDQWASGGPASLGLATNKSIPPTQLPSETLRQTLNALSITFEQYDAFVVLLRTLISPPPLEDPQTTTLAFPDDLGASYRMPGISPYLDVVFQQLFTRRLSELSDEGQIRLLRIHCLDLIATSLETFNESFVAMFDQNTLSKGSLEKPTRHTVYAQRHPFARTMEWLLTSDVIESLMACTHQPLENISSAASDSVLIASLVRSLDILNFAFDLQPTYLDIVRPLNRTAERSALATASAIASFEDVISGHPSIISDLRLYASSDHNQLVIRSLALLQRLSSSRKLNSMKVNIGSTRPSSRRIVDMLGSNMNSTEVCMVLAQRMHTDLRELESGAECAGYMIKDAVLAFLNGCLSADANVPNVAHLFLGFSRVGETLTLIPGGPVEKEVSLLNSIIDLVQTYPDGESGSYISWLIHIKTAAMHVLRQLWTAPLSSALTIVELRKARFLSSQFCGQAIISAETWWDGIPIAAPAFWHGKAGDAMAEFLSYRAFLFEYAATELRSAQHLGLRLSLNELYFVFTGKGGCMNGSQTPSPSIFDLLDFADLDIGDKWEMPQLKYFATLNLEACLSQSPEDSTAYYDLDMARELLQLNLKKPTANDQSQGSAEADAMSMEAQMIVHFLEAANRWSLVQAALIQALHMWTELVTAIIQSSPLDVTNKIRFDMRALELILPKLNAFVVAEAAHSMELARLANALVIDLTSQTPATSATHTSDIITERLFQLFKVCLIGISGPKTSSEIREIFYGICSRCLVNITSRPEVNRKIAQLSMENVKSAGLPLLNMLADDADDGQESCQLAALSLLTLLASLSRTEKSTFIIDALVKVNVLEVLLEPIKRIASDFQASEPQDRKHLLDVTKARLSLLLQISRTRDGAGYVLDAGLLPAIRESMLFRADPDLGIDVDSVQALHNYYELLSFVLRLLVSTFLSKGVQNEQCQTQMTSFLQEYRPNLVGLLKKYNGHNGTISAASRKVLESVIENYVALMAMTNFIEFEEEGALGHFARNGFT